MVQEENECIENNKAGKFYHKTWFLIVAGIAMFVTGYAAGTEGNFESEEVTNGSGQEGAESESQESSEITPVPVDLTTGTWTFGVDIEPGRYTATPVGGSGNLFIHGSVDVIETLGSEAEFGHVPSVTFTIKEGDTIEISGLPAVHFEPVVEGESVAIEDKQEDVEVENQDAVPVDLSTGTWTCGVDIAPGRYVATPEGGAGLLLIVGKSTSIVGILNDGSYDGIYNVNGEEIHGVPSITCTIEEGDIIEIYSLPSVHFEPVE